MQVMFHERGGPFAVDLLHGLVPPNERAAVIMRIMAADNDPIVERARKIARARDAEAPRA